MFCLMSRILPMRSLAEEQRGLLVRLWYEGYADWEEEVRAVLSSSSVLVCNLLVFRLSFILFKFI